MSAPNFHKTETNNYYVIDLIDLDEFLIDSELEFVKEFIKEQLSESYFYYEPGSKNIDSELRSYPTESFAGISESKMYGDCEITIEVNLLIRSGYYSSCNLDTETKILFDGYELDYDLFERFNDYYNTGFSKILKKHAEKWINKTIKKLHSDIFEVYKNCTETYIKTAQFSNGEAMYIKEN